MSLPSYYTTAQARAAGFVVSPVICGFCREKTMEYIKVQDDFYCSNCKRWEKDSAKIDQKILQVLTSATNKDKSDYRLKGRGMEYVYCHGWADDGTSGFTGWEFAATNGDTLLVIRFGPGFLAYGQVNPGTCYQVTRGIMDPVAMDRPYLQYRSLASSVRHPDHLVHTGYLTQGIIRAMFKHQTPLNVIYHRQTLHYLSELEPGNDWQFYNASALEPMLCSIVAPKYAIDYMIMPFTIKDCPS